MPELLARAYRASFTGTLVLEPADEAASSVRLVEGAVVEASGPFRSGAVEWDALGSLLPDATLDFARSHAAEYGVGPFAAVERLALLPSESLAVARQALVVEGVRELSGLSGDVRYAFMPPVEPGDPAADRAAVEPLGLLMACFLVDAQRERAARSVAGFEHTVLSVDPARGRRLLATVHGAVRAVLENLLLAPRSVQSLREQNLLPAAELVAAVCALFVTREVTVPGLSERPAATDSVPPFVPATSNMPPPRKSSGFMRAETRRAETGAQEHAMELKVEEAWMKAEADPSRAHQVSAVVLKAVSVFPKNPRLRYYLARLHVQASRFEDAARELRHVIELDPSDTQAKGELDELRSRFGAGLGS